MPDLMLPFDPMHSAVHSGVWLPGEIRRSAVLSADGRYRWTLSRTWGRGPICAWAMLNPSTADARIDDPTIRRCMSFARGWGYGGITAVNLYGLRSTDPKALWAHPDPVGPGNDAALAFVAEHCPLIMLAWGDNGRFRERRVAEACQILHRAYEYDGQLATLGWTKNDQPRHPLYVRGDTVPIPWYGEELADV